VQLTGTATPGTAYGPLWSDSFDAYPLGPLTLPWTDESGGGPTYAEISSTVVHGPSGRSLHLVDTDAFVGATAARALGSVMGVDMTVWAYAMQTTGFFTPILSAGSTGDPWQTVRAGMGPTGFFVYHVCLSGWTTSPVPYVAGRWYQIRVVASTGTDTYDLYVDGALLAGGVALCVPSSTLSVARMVSAGSYVGEFYVDDVSLDVEEPVAITEYRWDVNGAVDANGDGNFTNDADRLGASALVDYGDSGDFLVTLTVTDSSGYVTNDTLIVSVANLRPEVTIAPQTPISITTGESLTMQARDAGSDDLTLSWSWSDGPAGDKTFLNGATPDPPLSPGGVFPFTALDSQSRGFPSPGLYTITLTVVDDDGGSNQTAATVDVRDVPATTLFIGPPVFSGAFTYVNASSTISLLATDRSGRGIDGTYYRIDAGPAFLYSAPFALSQRGVHNVSFWSTDRLGGIEAPRSALLYVDLDAPATSLTAAGRAWSNGTTVWITPLTRFFLDASDSGSGVGETWQRVWDGASWTPWSTAPLPASPPVGNGSMAVEFYSTDNLGQSEGVRNASFAVDGAPPSVELIVVQSDAEYAFTVTVVASDAGSGVDRVEYRIGAGAWTEYTGPVTIRGKSAASLEVRAIDHVGNAGLLNRTLAPQYMNYKPVLSLVLAVLLLAVGVLLARRRKARIGYALAAGFAAAEGALGVTSLVGDVLLFPPWAGAGFAVDVGLTVAGIAVFVAYRPRGPSPPTPPPPA